MSKVTRHPESTDSPELSVARGNVAGQSSLNKFGQNIEVDSGVVADIWDGGHTADESLIWVAPTAARTHQITSDSANDTSGGTGCRTLRVYGLTDWDTNEVNEDITMNGTANVATSNSYVIIHRMHTLTKGATASNVGTITATADSDSTVTAKIRPTLGQTLMAIYGVPSTQTLYIGRIYANANKAGGAAGLFDFKLLYNPEPDAELTNFLIKHTFGLQTVGTSAFLVPYFVPKKFAGPGILKIQCISGTNNMDISSGFDGILVDN